MKLRDFIEKYKDHMDTDIVIADSGGNLHYLGADAIDFLGVDADCDNKPVIVLSE